GGHIGSAASPASLDRPPPEDTAPEHFADAAAPQNHPLCAQERRQRKGRLACCR
ncbi:hypothetical protein FRC07_007673, partial [Ceratobasidium sp. 392]